LDPSYLRICRYCCILARNAYCKKSERTLPPEISNIDYESEESSLYYIPYYIVNSPQLNHIFISCRGSYTMTDWVADLMAKPEEWGHGYVHHGIFKIAQNLFKHMQQTLLPILAKNPNRCVFFTGHSLGAAVAGVLVEMFQSAHPSIQPRGIIFASAAALSLSLWQNSRSRTVCFVTDGDFVPFLDLANFEGIPDDALPPPVQKVIRKAVKAQMEEVFIQRQPRPRIDGTANPFEAPPPALDVAVTPTMERGGRAVPLMPPGEAYVLELVVVKGERMVVLKRVDGKGYFGKFTNHLNEFRHKMDVYYLWLDWYCRRVFGESTAGINLE
jgi:hypothetical protein